MRALLVGLLGLTLLASALVSGFFYAYHWSVMPGLAAAEPAAAIAAMQGINRVVRNAVFAFSFFGTLGFGIVTTVMLIVDGRRLSATCAAAGVLLYGLGAFAVTLIYNVPLNEQLAAATPTAQTAAGVWRDFVVPWMRWNLVRTVASILAFLAFAAAFWFDAARPVGPPRNP